MRRGDAGARAPVPAEAQGPGGGPQPTRGAAEEAGRAAFEAAEEG